MRLSLGLIAGLFALTSSNAAVIPVTSLADEGKRTLREAILKANQTRGADQIVLVCKGTIILKSQLPAITGKTTISGLRSRPASISGGGQNPILTTDSREGVLVQNLELKQGFVKATNFLVLEVGGAAVRNYGKLQLQNCEITDCSSETESVAIHNQGTMEINNCRIKDCSAAPAFDIRGVIANYGSLSVNSTVVSASSGVRAGAFQNFGSLRLAGCSIKDCAANYGQGDGGALRNFGTARISDTTITNCRGYWGGGILSLGFLAMTNSSISECRADFGGGVMVFGSAIIEGSSFFGNNAFIAGALHNEGTNTWVLNSTISSNTAWFLGYSIANGFLSPLAAALQVHHCTIVGGDVFNDGDLWAGNTIFSFGTEPSFDGELVSLGYNLIQDAENCVLVGERKGVLMGVDPLLGPLKDNGGPTLTHELLEGSPCIDAGSQAGLPMDQRGLPRPFNYASTADADDGSDIGAFELRESQKSSGGRRNRPPR